MSRTEFQPPATAHPASPFQVLSARPERIGPRDGILEVSLACSTYAEGESRTRGGGPGPGDVLRYPVPGVPVLLVDGQPVAEGVGTVWVRLAPGVHRVAVQAGGFAGWWPVEVRAGRVTVLEAQPIRAWMPGHDLPLVPDRFASQVRYWTILAYLPAAFVCTLLLFVIPGCIIGVFTPDLLGTDTRRNIGYGVFAAVAVALFVVMTARHLGTMRLTKRHLRTHAELAAAPSPGGFGAHSLPPGLPRVPEEAGTEGVLLDLTWETVWQRIATGTDIDWLWMQYSGEPGPVREHAWMPAPVVSVDGVEHELDWGRWWIPLTPGEHHLDVAVPRTAPAAPGDRPVRWQGTVETTPEWYTRIRLDARVVQYTDTDRTTLRATSVDAEVKPHMTIGRLPDFREHRTPTEPLDGQTDVRLRHSSIERSNP